MTLNSSARDKCIFVFSIAVSLPIKEIDYVQK